MALALIGGTVTGLLVMVAGPWELGVLVGWNVTALSFMVTVWARIARSDGAETRLIAGSEDNTSGDARLLLTGAAIASLLAVLLGVLKARSEPGAVGAALMGTSLSTVIVSWILVHTLYTVHYARLYYRGEPGGLDFNDREVPAYADFAYLAFTIGMTYQVSDTPARAPQFRGAILRHALLSYLFGTVIIAVTINIVAGLAR